MRDTDDDGRRRGKRSARNPAEFLAEAARVLEEAIARGQRVQIHVGDDLPLSWQPAPPPGSSLFGAHKGQIEILGDIDSPGVCLCCGRET